MSTPANQKVLSGNWNDNISWEFFLSEDIPDRSMCKVVYCLAILPKTEQIVLTHIKRGWEMLGGHLEPGEILEEGLVRECLEEGGFYPDSYKQFGYMKLHAKEPVKNDHHGGYYPQVAYVPHFVAITTRPLVKPSGEEVLGSGSFTLDEIAKTNTNHEAIIRAGMETYLAEQI